MTKLLLVASLMLTALQVSCGNTHDSRVEDVQFDVSGGIAKAHLNGGDLTPSQRAEGIKLALEDVLKQIESCCLTTKAKGQLQEARPADAAKVVELANQNADKVIQSSGGKLGSKSLATGIVAVDIRDTTFASDDAKDGTMWLIEVSPELRKEVAIKSGKILLSSYSYKVKSYLIQRTGSDANKRPALSFGAATTVFDNDWHSIENSYTFTMMWTAQSTLGFKRINHGSNLILITEGDAYAPGIILEAPSTLNKVESLKSRINSGLGNFDNLVKH